MEINFFTLYGTGIYLVGQILTRYTGGGCDG